jgi:hypothetical protein
MATKYSISKDHFSTNLTVSKNSANQVFLTKNPGFTKAYFTKSGGTEVSIGKNAVSALPSAIPDGSIVEPDGLGRNIVEPTTGDYIIEP